MKPLLSYWLFSRHFCLTKLCFLAELRYTSNYHFFLIRMTTSWSGNIIILSLVIISDKKIKWWNNIWCHTYIGTYVHLLQFCYSILYLQSHILLYYSFYSLNRNRPFCCIITVLTQNTILLFIFINCSNIKIYAIEIKLS